MSSREIPMCKMHLDRRGFSYEGWMVPDEKNPCHQCTTGYMPDWELSVTTPEEDKAYEDHIRRLMERAAAQELISRPE